MFVMVAVVIVIVVVGYFVVRDVGVGDDGIDSEVRPVYEAVKGCIADVTEDSIDIVGQSGGYFDLPEKVDNNLVAYYFYEDESLMPSLEVVEGEMEKYTKNMLYFCVEKAFVNFADFEFNSGEIVVVVDVRSDDYIYFEVNYPFSVVKGNKSYSFNEPFNEVYEVRLFSIYSFVAQMMEWQVEEPRAFCINCVSDAALELGVFVNMWSFAPGDATIYITDEESIINGEPYLFFFTNKYLGGNYDPFENM